MDVASSAANKIPACFPNSTNHVTVSANSTGSTVETLISTQQKAGLIALFLFAGLIYLELSAYNQIEDQKKRIVLSAAFLLSAANLGTIYFLWGA